MFKKFAPFRISMAQEKYEEGSLMDYASQGFSNIKKLSESGLISEKLLGLSSILFVLIISLAITHWLSPGEVFSLNFLIIFSVSLVFGFGLSLIYSPLLSLFSGFSNSKIRSLRRGVILLFMALPLSVAGIIYSLPLLIKISLVLLVFQLFGSILIGVTLSSNERPIEDQRFKGVDIWRILDRLGAFSSIISFIITVLILIFN